MPRRFVICAVLLLTMTPLSWAQFSTARPAVQKRDTGPRALALLELSPNGTGRLVPIAIMIGDDFFDASAYKADPVPMALDSGTVYEAMQTGVSQGLFTISTAAQTGIYWTGRGKWQTSAEIAAAAAAKKKRAQAEDKPPTLSDPDSGPPKLLRRSVESKPSSPPAEPAKPSASSPAPQNPAPTASKTAPASPAPDQSKPAEPKSTQSTPAPTAPATSTSAKAEAPPASSAPAAAPAPASPDPSEASDEEDPNRPRLDRGKPSASRKRQATEANGSSKSSLNTKTAASAKPGASPLTPKTSSAFEGPSVPDSVQEIPAISDASGPEPRPYAFPLKPGEADQFRKKLLEQATQLVDAKIKQQSSGVSVHRTVRTSAKSKSTAHVPAPTFENVKLRIFDLSSSNQALMVLEATAQVAGLAEPQQITIVARQDLYGDLHDALANVTDQRHLDVIPQMDLIDVVDADGDGRGELLFRETSDEGRAYSIYRVIGDQLYQLYKSTPQ